MRRRSLFPSIALVLPVVVVACEPEDTASVALAMTAPQGILDDASGVTLYVFESDAECAEDGSIERPADAKEYPLSKSGCEDGATWCGELKLDKDSSTQVFYVEVVGSGSLTARGCTKAKVDRDPLAVDIKIVRYVPPSCCGDGTLQAGELCDTGPLGGTCSSITADAVCEADCSTKELPVDFVDTPNGNNGQTHLSLAFAGGAEQLKDALRATWQTNTAATSDVGVRYFASDLSPITTPPQFGEPHRLNVDCDGSDTPLPNGQRLPAVAPLGNGVVIAFISNYTAPLRDDVQAMEIPATGCTSNATPLNVSNPMGNDAAVSVDVATGTLGTALVVWEQAGQILGRTITSNDPSPATLGTITTIAGSGRAPRVGGYAGGWIVAYESGDDVLYSKVTSSMTVDPAKTANVQTSGVQDQPDVAVLSDGRFAIVWRSDGNVFFQRYALDGSPVAGDQDAAAHVVVDGAKGAPAVAGGGELYALAWEDGASLRGRLLGANGGFLFNAVTGQNDDFVITRSTAAPKKPAIAVGSYLVFGWEDMSAAAPGMYVRRFPLPQ
jgi:predicted lipoprotein with Yx(FWY)xxD motif